MKNFTEGIIDMHIHSAPDVRQRKLNDLEIMEAAVARGVRAVVIKSHHVPTADRATLVNQVAAEKYGADVPFTMFGGIALNRWVGGLNPYAVETALKLGAKVVWLPTMSSENHCMKGAAGPAVICTREGRAVDELKDIFLLVKDYDAVLATGHISDKECFIIAEAARNAGVRKVVITHPEFHIVGMSLEDQIKIVKDYDVMLEKVYAQPIGGGVYKKNLADNVAVMREIPAKNIIVATDGGQMQNPEWYNTITEYVKYLYDAGIPKEDIVQMTQKNPAAMLGLSI